MVCLSLIAVNSCSNTSDEVSETQIPAATTATTGPALNPTTTTGSESPSSTSDDVSETQTPAVTTSRAESASSSEVGDPVTETLAFEPLLAVAPASEICRQNRYLGSSASEKIHLLCEFTPDVAPDVTLTFLVDYPLLEHTNGDAINDQVRAKVAEILDGYLNNGVLWPSLSRHWPGWMEILGRAEYTPRGKYDVEFTVDAYHPAAANPVQTFYYLRFDLDTGSMNCQDRFGYNHGGYGSDPGTYRYSEFVPADSTLIPDCPDINFEQDDSDFNIGKWVRTGIEFDVANATFDVRCPGILGGGAYPRLTTFVDGVADPPYVGGNGYIRVREEAVVELVEESPGPEVIASIGCWGGGTGTSIELQVFAGNNAEAKRLGQIIEGRILDSTSAAHWGLGSHFVARRYEYQTGDTNNQQSKFTSLVYRWKDGGWAETVHEAWVRETQPDIDPDVALSGIELDVANATLDLDCWMALGSTTFIDGEWINEADFLNRAWVTKWEVVELVEESPGPEVAVEIACSGGGSHTQFEVHVYAGNSDEPRRLGRILGELLHGVSEFSNRFVTKARIWRDDDAHCCPSQYELIWYEWQDSDWVETDSEIWGRGPDAERL